MIILLFMVQEFRDHLPQNRALRDTETREQAVELLKLRCAKPLIQKKIENKSNKRVMMKDLHNLALKLHNPEDDSLKEALKLLENEYSKHLFINICSVKLLA